MPHHHGRGEREYYNPPQLADTVGPHAVEWYALRCCLSPTGKRLQRLAKVLLMLIAFLAAMAQWSALASGVALFVDKVKLGKAAGAEVTSAAFSVCFLSTIVGGALGDGKWGCTKVLFAGLVGAVAAGAVTAALCYPNSALETLAPRIILSIAVFFLAGALGFTQTALSTLVGDQCRDHPGSLGTVYNVYYGCVQVGALIARIAFPLVDDEANWFFGMIGFVTLPIALALLIFSTHSPVITTKVPVRYSPIVLSLRILGRRLCGTDYEELCCYYTEKVVRDAFKSARVLRIHVTLPIFWALYFQMFGLWYLQTKDLNLELWSGTSIVAEQATVLNPLFDVLCLLLFGCVFFFLRWGCRITVAPQWRVFAGFFCAVLAFACATFLQYKIHQQQENGHHKLSVVWQLPQFILICAGEILVYPSALHLAYVNSPASNRSFVQSALWFSIGLGNALNTIIMSVASDLVRHNSKLPIYLTYSGLMAVTLFIYAIQAYHYKEQPADDEDSTVFKSADDTVTSQGKQPQTATPMHGSNPSIQPDPSTLSGSGQQFATPNTKCTGSSGGTVESSPTGGYSTPPHCSFGNSSEKPTPASHLDTPQRLHPYDGVEEQQPLLGSPAEKYARRSTSQLSTSSQHQARPTRRLPTPRKGGVTYYSTRKSPRTSALDTQPFPSSSSNPQQQPPSPLKFDP